MSTILFHGQKTHGTSQQNRPKANYHPLPRNTNNPNSTGPIAPTAKALDGHQGDAPVASGICVRTPEWGGH